jgi:hypothetical protein
MLNDSHRYRLRVENKIVGYKKRIHNTTFYSKDQYAWNGQVIQATIEDKFSGFYDKNRRAIYAEDIIEFIYPITCRYALILFDEILQTFQILDLENSELIPENWAEYLKKNPFTFKSYNFIQSNV